MSSTKIVIFGDTGGHLEQLMSSLQNLGVNTTDHIIPEGLRIIHLGDLIHKGPDSNEIVEFVDMMIKNNGTQKWTQILGNHEYMHIVGPKFWACTCSPETKKTLLKWSSSKKAFPSTFIKNEIIKTNSPVINDSLHQGVQPIFLLSHAGLNRKYWLNVIGDDVTDPEKVSKKINSLNYSILLKSGAMLDTGGGFPAGPVWALSTTEVYEPWEAHKTDAPFSQIFGHTTGYGWQSKRYYATVSQSFLDNVKLDHKNRLCVATVANSLQICCDPDYNVKATTLTQPYLALYVKEETNA